tara:strand:- start:178 stop:1218 length:1041 start_codon:yes stop_codon:yes gene_type:complete
MNKGIFSIPVHKSNTNVEVVLNEVFKQTIKADEWGLKEAFFGEHITDKHEKIASSLMMVASLSKVTKKIKLGSLTTNLNFFNPATAASLISMVDNLTNGRLILGVGSGANMSDVEAINSIDKENHSISLESLDIIKKLLNSDDLIDISSKNFKVSTKKFGSKKLGLGYFNGLYNQRDNLEIVMPALNKNSYNVKLCAKNQWSIVISNFCSESIIENHIKNYLNNSPLNEKEALKKIKLSKLIFVHEDKSMAKKLVYSEDSPFMNVTDIIFNKLKTFNKHSCFGEGVENVLDAAKSIILFGDPEEVTKKISDKYGNLSSIIYITVPITGNENFDKSLENFSRHVKLQ